MKYLIGFVAAVLLAFILFFDSGVRFLSVDDWKRCRAYGCSVWTSQELADFGNNQYTTGFFHGMFAAKQQQKDGL